MIVFIHTLHVMFKSDCFGVFEQSSCKASCVVVVVGIIVVCSAVVECNCFGD